MQNIYQAKGKTLIDQFRDVGALFGESIRKSVHKIGKKRSRLTKARREVAERTWTNVQKKEVCREFCDCLRAWSEGAGVTVEQAMWFMADNLTGCQTFMARYGSGVALLHSEEEFRGDASIELHMTSPHTMEFRDGVSELRTLVYNNLMPGAGLYGWKKDKIVAVDSLFLREDGIDKVESPLLANVVAWLIWRMDPNEADPAKIVQLVGSIGELIDGYAINVVRKVGGHIDGYKLTFARSEHHTEYLGEQAGSYLRQVNIVDPSYPKMKWALPPKNIWRGGYKYFVARLKTMDQHAKQFAGLKSFNLSAEQVEEAHKQIQATIFGDLSEFYVNVDMGAACVGLVDASGSSVSTKLNDNGDVTQLEYIDQQ